MVGIADVVKDWGGFEKLIASLNETGDVTVEHDVTLRGRSGALRQIDVLVRHKTGLYEHLIVVECKHWRRRVQRLHVDALATTCREVGASRGVIFSIRGFQAGAIQQARHDNIDLFRVRDLTDDEWGQPGQVVDFLMHIIQGSAGNIQLKIANTWQLMPVPTTSEVHLNIVLSHDDNGSQTPLLGNGRFETLEALLKDAMHQGLQNALGSGFTLNGGEECEAHMMAQLVLNLEPPARVVASGVLIEISGVHLDLGIKVRQARFVLDRGDYYAFALAIEDHVRGVTSTASRGKASAVTVLRDVLGRDTAPDGDTIENGSVARIFLRSYFDFAEFDGKVQTPLVRRPLE